MRTNSKRAIALGSGIAAVAAAGVAYAASVGLSSSTLGSNDAQVGDSACTLAISYPAGDLSYDKASTDYVLSGIQVVGTGASNAACLNQHFKVTLTDGGNNPLAEATGDFPTPDAVGGSTFTVTESLSATPKVGDIQHVYAVITP